MNSGRRASLARLRGRSLRELRFRGAQAASALLERLGVGDLVEERPEGLAQHLRATARARGVTAWCRAFRARGGTGFFAGVDDAASTVRASRAVDAAGADAVLRAAGRALNGRFDLLGHRDLSFGTPVDWHLDPVMNVRSPRAHWSRIAYLDPAVSGDHKVVWELNRHQWMVSLGQAWRLTGEDRFARGAGEHLDQWMDANPPKIGVNWASSLEIAFRAISWLWTLRLLGDAPGLRDETVVRAVGHLRLAARHLERNLSTYFSPNTHLTGEALALFYLGHELRDLAEADRWRTTGRAVLLTWLPTHVRPDGTYFEQSTWYHRYTLDFYLHFLLLAERAGDPVPGEVREAIGRLGQVLAHCARPDGSVPLLGDDDGGRLLFLDGRTQRDARPALANAGIVARRPELCALGEVTSETLWLLGPDAANRAGQMDDQASLPSPSRCFPDGGLVVLRDGWGPAASVLVMDAGPHGAMNCGHAHADALGFDLTMGGVALLVDPGTMAYTTDRATRDRFRSTAAHNAATVDGADSSEMTGPFSWGRVATARVTGWSAHPSGDWVAAVHDGFDDAPGSATAGCEREVVRVAGTDGALWLVRDRFSAEREFTLQGHLQCAPGIEARVVAPDRVRLRRGDTDVADVLAPDGIVAQCVGEVSCLYGASTAAPHLSVTRHGRGTVTVTTVIGPAGLGNARHTDQPHATILVIPSRSSEFVVILSDAGEVECGSLAVEARAFWAEREPGGGAIRWWRAVGARCVRDDGRVVMESPAARDLAWSASETFPNQR